MRLTRYTDLALRAMMRLAVVDDEELLTTRQLAASMNVPYTHMAKAVAQLQRLGVIEARRGRNGGLSVTDAGRRTPVGDLVRTLEGDREAVVCEGDTPCPLAGACRLRRALRDAQEAFYSALNGVTVADLVTAPTGPLLLSLGAPPD